LVSFLKGEEEALNITVVVGVNVTDGVLGPWSEGEESTKVTSGSER
jgi:hypothetical protein